MKKTYPDGSKYNGDHKWQGLKKIRHGQGTLIVSGGAKYEGEWKDDKKHGQGTYIFLTGAKYEGEWKDDKHNGQGTKTFLNGAKYEGEWKDDKKNGQGIYMYSTDGQYEGEKYEGEWKDDKIHGYGNGTFFVADGDKYEGELKDGKKHGHGTFFFADGDKYEGEWKDGKKHGHGTFFFSSGAKHEGEWKDDKKHGQFIITSANGTRQRGEIIDDKLQGTLRVILEKEAEKIVVEKEEEKRNYDGWVYILLNQAYPEDWVKIGMTTRTSQIRIRELSEGSAMPLEFRLVYEREVYDCAKVEKLIHKELHKYRITGQRYDRRREWFKLPNKLAIDTMNKIADEENTKVETSILHSV